MYKNKFSDDIIAGMSSTLDNKAFQDIFKSAQKDDNERQQFDEMTQFYDTNGLDDFFKGIIDNSGLPLSAIYKYVTFLTLVNGANSSHLRSIVNVDDNTFDYVTQLLLDNKLISLTKKGFEITDLGKKFDEFLLHSSAWNELVELNDSNYADDKKTHKEVIPMEIVVDDPKKVKPLDIPKEVVVKGPGDLLSADDTKAHCSCSPNCTCPPDCECDLCIKTAVASAVSQATNALLKTSAVLDGAGLTISSVYAAKLVESILKEAKLKVNAQVAFDHYQPTDLTSDIENPTFEDAESVNEDLSPEEHDSALAKIKAEVAELEKEFAEEFPGMTMEEVINMLGFK